MNPGRLLTNEPFGADSTKQHSGMHNAIIARKTNLSIAISNKEEQSIEKSKCRIDEKLVVNFITLLPFL